MRRGEQLNPLLCDPGWNQVHLLVAGHDSDLVLALIFVPVRFVLPCLRILVMYFYVFMIYVL